MLISLTVGITITFLIWLCHDFLIEKIPLFLFNLAGILSLPGNIIILIIVAIVSPEKGWQALHGTSPYSYLSYGANFLFYFFLSYLVQFLIFKYLKSKNKEI